MTETHLGQIKIDGEWKDYARSTREEAVRWAEADPENRRVVDWIYKERILWPESSLSFTLNIKCDGAAFTQVTNDDDNGKSHAGPEVAALLRKIADRIAATSAPARGGDEWPIVSTDGALVGIAFFTEEA